MSQLTILDAGKTAQTLSEKKKVLSTFTGKMHIPEAPSSDTSKNFAIEFRESWTEPQGTEDMNIAVLSTAPCTGHSEKKAFQDAFFKKECLHLN